MRRRMRVTLRLDRAIAIPLSTSQAALDPVRFGVQVYGWAAQFGSEMLL